MGDTGRFALFLSIALGIWTLFHVYVGWRVHGLLENVTGRRILVIALVALWFAYPLGRVLARVTSSPAAVGVQFLGALWMGILFLLVFAFLASEIPTGFGFLLRDAHRWFRLATLALAGILSIAALVQGMRPPVVRPHTVVVRDLPLELDGTVLVHLTDLHLGELLGPRWMMARVRQVDALNPDLIVITGDLVDGSMDRMEPLIPACEGLQAPWGVWAVTGNHEFYAGVERSAAFMERAGIRVLRDEWAEAAPGLVLIGVDDPTARRQFGRPGADLESILADAPERGGRILLAHSPVGGEAAAANGVDLMLSGHTHGGQIWPFGEIVRLAYPMLAGRYDIGRLTVLVSRGTGTWGPPMRLFRRGEILVVTLRAERPGGGSHAVSSPGTPRTLAH